MSVYWKIARVTYLVRVAPAAGFSGCRRVRGDEQLEKCKRYPLHLRAESTATIEPS